MVLSGGGLILLNTVNSLWHFYGVFILLSIGTSCGLGMGQYVAVANWFAKKRTWAMAVMSVGFAFSGAVGPLLVWLIGRYGWRGTLVIMGMVMWVVGIPLGLVIRHRPEPYGYLPDGESPELPSQSGDITGLSTGTVMPAPRPVRPVDLTAREALMTRTFWMLIVFGTLTGFAQAAVNVHEMPYLTSVGIIGRLGFGWLGDRYDKRYLLAIGSTLQFLGVFIFSWISSPWMIIPFVLLYGPGYASQIPLWPSIRADYFGLKHYATIGGLQSMAWTICGIVAPLLAGWVFDVYGTYRPIWLAYAIATAIAVPFIFLIRIKRE
jgi:MFS family permease